ncbi:MAG TPA: MBL fold metallo-hydrolase [Casimicrobiaceae bacterium]|nr:MBL fold metallo-hydrolase [Casimicrobiaceae bacterium]
MKRIRFWGTRGSLPVSLTAAGVRRKLVTALRGASGRVFNSDREIDEYLDGLGIAVAGTYGGHSPCVELETGGSEYVLCDLGSGLRPFGQAAIARHGPSSPQTYHIFVSHVHWDHIMGLPFFTPAYIPGNRVRFYGCHPWLEAALRRQQENPSFPVDFSYLRANIEFTVLKPGKTYDIAGMSVTAKLQRHAGDSYGYRFEANGKSVVYTTDSEHKLADPAETEGIVEFFRKADVVIFDAMYSLAEATTVKADWGHSSNVVGVELCQLAEVRHLCLFHHEPANEDEAISRILEETRRLEEITRTRKPMHVSAAYDGMEIEL